MNFYSVGAVAKHSQVSLSLAAGGPRPKDKQAPDPMKVNAVGSLLDQASCVGEIAFNVYKSLLLAGKSVKSVQRRVEYYINKSLESTYARQCAARIFNEFANKWKLSSESGRVDLSVQAFAVDEWSETNSRISIRLVVRTRIADMAS